MKTGAMHAVEPGTATRLPVQGVHAGLLLPVLDMDELPGHGIGATFPVAEVGQ